MGKPSYQELNKRLKELQKIETERKQEEEAVRWRVELIELISILSTTFINLSPDETDEEITNTLELVGKFSNVDRSYVFLFSDDRKKMNNTHEWYAEGIEPQTEKLQDLQSKSFPWWMKKLKKFENIYIPRVAALPRSAKAEKDILLSQGIQSLIVVPIVYDNSLVGFLGFDSVRSEKRWEKENIALLKIISNIFANALKCKWGKEELYRTEEQLKQHKEHLEEKVKERTAELTEVNEELQVEISERKRVEEDLRESEERYRLLAENVTDIIWKTDMNLMFTYVSSSIKRILGYSVEEATGKKIEEILTSESYKIAARIFVEELTEEKREKKDLFRSRTAEFEIMRKDGSTVICETRMTFLRDQSDNPVEVIGVTRDISERRKTERELNIVYGAVETSLNAIFAADIEGIVTYANPEAAKLWGFKNTKAMVGTNVLDYWTKESKKKAKEIIKILLRKSSYSGEELIGKRKDGTEFPVRVKSSMIKDKSGNPISMIGTFYEIANH